MNGHRGWLARRLCYVLFVLERDVQKDMFARNVMENVLNNSRVKKATIDVAEENSPGLESQLDHKAVSKVKRKARAILQEMVANISPAFIRHRGWLARRLCYVLFVLERDVQKDMFARNVMENVLNNSRVKKATIDVAEENSPGLESQLDHKAVSKVKRKARAILQEMVANISPAFIRITGWVLLKLFNGFFWSIQIHKGQLEMVKKAATEVSMHSLKHRGWLARRLCYVLFVLERDVQKDMFARNVMENVLNNSRVKKATIDVAEENSPGLESQLDHKAVSKVKRKARAILQEMVANISPAFIRHRGWLARRLCYVLFVLERDVQKDMFARNVMENVLNNSRFYFNDVLIVPVGISYDRIIEGNYNSEQLGKPKKNESLWGVAQGVFRMLRKNYGCVRVDFTQPFSLKEYLDTQRNRPLPAPLTLEQILVPTILSTRPNQVLFDDEEAERHNLRDLTDEPWRRQVISNLAKHALFTANKSSAVMSTHIVACLLLYRHRQGVCLSKLVEDFFSMKEEVLARDFDLGFSGNSEDVVMHALHLFGNCVNITSASRNTEFFISPSTAIPALFELNFYSNGLFHVFITEAIIVEAYSSAAIFVHSLRGPVTERDYTNQLFKYLITRTEKKVAAFGESATHHLVKNTVKTFKELGVFKEKRENSVSVLELSSTFLPQANRNKLLQYILHFSVL
ncbi:UNVERIFIED_CONTAM: hypothetical protein FKN15_015673 [Acipenser sinensis]